MIYQAFVSIQGNSLNKQLQHIVIFTLIFLVCPFPSLLLVSSFIINHYLPFINVFGSKTSPRWSSFAYFLNIWVNKCIIVLLHILPLHDHHSFPIPTPDLWSLHFASYLTAILYSYPAPSKNPLNSFLSKYASSLDKIFFSMIYYLSDLVLS